VTVMLRVAWPLLDYSWDLGSVLWIVAALLLAAAPVIGKGPRSRDGAPWLSSTRSTFG
jgi:hypothetical protein